LYRTGGSLEEWRTNVARLCVGNSRLVFAVSVAFAACMLELVKADGAGFHLRGLSSTGKTTLLLGGGSVWGGGGQNGYLDTWRATANGLEAKGALHNHALLCLDEFGEVSERDVGEIIYALGNGGGKGRMSKYLTSRASNTFKLLYLSSGERSLADAMHSSGHFPKGGQEVRLIDIEADAGAGMGVFEHLHEFESPAKLSLALSQAAKTYYGTPIRPFLQYVADNPDGIRESVLAGQSSFLRRNLPPDAVGEIHRVASVFALVASAGTLASGLEITGWSEADVLHDIEVVFHSWLATRGNCRAHSDVESGIRRTRAFLQANGASRFQNVAAPEEKTKDRAGFRQQSPEGWIYYLYPATFQGEICDDCDYKAVAKEMMARGYMRRNVGRHLGNKKSISGEGRPRLIEILPSMFEEREETDEGEAPTQEEEPVGHVGHVGRNL
jgi:putative DNA primase/helicase